MKLIIPITLGTLLTVSALPSLAASHSDAPLIKQDPQVNITDVYAFVGTKYNDSSVEVLNVVVQVRPFSDPGDPGFHVFLDCKSRCPFRGRRPPDGSARPSGCGTTATWLKHPAGSHLSSPR